MVWKTLGEAGPPIVNVCSRYGSVDYNGQRMIGLNNIELITDRPLESQPGGNHGREESLAGPGDGGVTDGALQ